MEMHQVRYFLTACETLNFSRAAEQCDVAVPSLTRAIRKLEEELGGQLFRRERHLTHLTDLGRVVQQHLVVAQAATEAAEREARAYGSLAAGHLKLGVMTTMGHGQLVGYLRALQRAAPGLEVHVWEAHCEELVGALREGEVDIALSGAPSFPDWCRPLPLYRERYLIAFPRGHRFERMNAVPLRELEGEDYVKRSHCEFPSNFATLGVARPYQKIRVRYRSEREDWVQAMVVAGLGCVVMAETLPILPGVVTRSLIEPEVVRVISLTTVAGRPHSTAVRAAVDVARRHDWGLPLPASGGGPRTGPDMVADAAS